MMALSTAMERVRGALVVLMRLCQEHWAILAVVVVLMGTEYASHRLTILVQRYLSDVAKLGAYSPLAVRGLHYETKDEVMYLAVARSIFKDGYRWNGGEAYVYEYRDTPTQLPPITFTTYGLFLSLFDDVETAFDTAKVLVVGLLPLSVYVFVVYAAGGRLLALVCATTAVFLFPLFRAFAPFTGSWIPFAPIAFLVKLAPPDERMVTTLMRIPITGMTYPWLLAAITALGWALNRRTMRSLAVAGVLTGVQPLVYPYYASSVALGLPLLAVWFALRRRFDMVRALAVIGGIAVVVAIPAFVQLWEVRHLPQYQDIVRALFSYSNEPSEISAYLAVFGALLALSLAWSGSWQHYFAVLMCTIAGAVLSMNLNVVTGVNPEAWHWFNWVISPLYPISLLLLGGMVVRRAVNRFGLAARWRTASVVLATSIVTFGLAYFVIGSMQYVRDRAGVRYLPYSHREAYEWLREHAEPNSVVAALSPEQIRLIPAYVGTYSYLPNDAPVVPYDETVTRWIAACHFYGMAREEFQGIISNTFVYELSLRDASLSAEAPPWNFERSTVHKMLFTKRFAERFPYVFPDSIKTDLMERFLAVAEPDREIRRCRVDYVWQGSYERAIGIDSLDKARDVELAFESGGVRIYRVLRRDTHDTANEKKN